MKAQPVKTRQLLRSLDRVEAALTRFYASKSCWVLIATLAVFDLFLVLNIVSNHEIITHENATPKNPAVAAPHANAHANARP